MIIALDAMGGDYAPDNNIAGLALALAEVPDVAGYAVVGQPDKINPLLAAHGIAGDPRLEVVPASQVITMSDASTAPLRQKKDSSIGVAARLMKGGRVDAIVTPGHTGAAVASTVVHNRTLPGIERPGIAGPFPSVSGSFIVVDVGANVDCRPLHLAQYGILGEAYARLVMGIARPRVGILSVGEEEGKGNELTREATALMHRLPFANFIGNVEGRDLFSGGVDVAVCDGFVGNIVLKLAEDLAKSMFRMLRDRLRKTPLRQAGALLSRNAFLELMAVSDNDEYGGAPLLGINGVCIIGHGSSSPKAVKNALRVAGEMVRKEINRHILEKLTGVDWAAVGGRPAVRESR
jgi:glycerol-3-phosphate acyltransferase PlsX